LHDVSAGDLLGLAAITLVLSSAYWLMRERDDYAAGRPARITRYPERPA